VHADGVFVDECCSLFFLSMLQNSLNSINQHQPFHFSINIASCISVKCIFVPEKMNIRYQMLLIIDLNVDIG
ncbi:MAG: hypothetical protein RLZZ543_1848, partial [Bacteroidota bacterium]